MKNTILILLTCIIFTGCTDVFRAETGVYCPCKITAVNEYKNNEFYITTTSISKESRYFKFYTTNRYNIGDTIK